MNYKKVLFLVLLMALSSLVFAQGFYAKGLKAGLNLASYGGDNTGYDYSTKVGYAIGCFATYGINEQFSLQPELLLTVKGSQIDYNDYFELSGSTNLTYLEIPVLMRFHFSRTSEMSPNFFAGPALGFNIGATYDYDINGNNMSGDIEDMNPIEFSMIFGAGIDTRQITFDVRYDMGLTTNIDPDDNIDIFNNVVSFMIGYKLN
jgi:hypothetical protein